MAGLGDAKAPNRSASFACLPEHFSRKLDLFPNSCTLVRGWPKLEKKSFC
jgi:hypothetical protein